MLPNSRDMSPSDAPIDTLEAHLAAVRARTRAKIPGRVQAILDAAAPSDDLRRLAHKLRGIADDPAVAEPATWIELGCRAGDTAQVQKGLDALRRWLETRVEEPVSHPAASQSEATLPRTGASVGRALVVDDDPAILKLVAMTLERLAHFEVQTASSLADARQAFQDATYELAVLDAQMPKTTGLELCSELRAVSPGTKIVILSAATAEQLGWSWGAEGPDAWWQKPLPTSEIVERVKALMKDPQNEA